MLAQLVPAEIFGFLLVFSRLGVMMMTLPALGERIIPGRVRLSIGLALTLVFYTVIRDSLPGLPPTVMGLFIAIGLEVIVGLFIGISARLILSSLQVAGTIIAFQSGLAAARNFDPTQNAQGALVGAFLTLLGIVTIFALDLHHMMLWAMRDSYTLFPIGKLMPVGDFAALATQSVARAFFVGVQIAAPFMVYGLVFNVGLGILARLMPQLHVFFVAMPLNIIFAFTIMAMIIGSIMVWFTDYFVQAFSAFLV